MLEVVGDAWKAAENVRNSVINGDMVVGHGDSMNPLYPNGTILVLQRLEWTHLRAGMTVVYEKSPDNPYNLVCHILIGKNQRGHWIMQGLDNDDSDAVTLNEFNYCGTVVAAFRSDEKSPFIVTREQLQRDPGAYCALRCHVDGVTHPMLHAPPSNNTRVATDHP